MGIVTSPNWMAPFHIERATACPRAYGRTVTIAWPGNAAAGRGHAAASTGDGERASASDLVRSADGGDRPVPRRHVTWMNGLGRGARHGRVGAAAHGGGPRPRPPPPPRARSGPGPGSARPA